MAGKTRGAGKPAEPGPLPPLYARWMRDLLKGPVSGEPEATCDDCAMCASAGTAPAASTLYFNPDAKCCTYIPELPNYLVGRILADADPALAHGRNTVRERLRAGAGVTPLGIAQPARFEILYGRAPSLFGRSTTLRCPHFIEEGGRCGVWRHRPSVCATWHCKHERGAVGKHFWKALHGLLTGVQRALARWCVLDLPTPVLSTLFPPMQPAGTGRPFDAADIDGTVNPEVYAASWGELRGREEDFYRGCARRVDALAWSEVRTIGGSELQVLERLLLAAWKEVQSSEVPEQLRPGSFRINTITSDSVAIQSYSDIDPVNLPGEVLELLTFFDGRPTDAVLKSIADERGVELEKDLVRRLVDFQILVRDS